MTPDDATLAAALPHILEAPKTDAPIRQLCLRPDYGQRAFVSSLTLTRDQGIPGERWTTAPWMRLADGSPDPRIQVSILPARVLDLVWHPEDAAPHPGDPIVADIDTSLTNLPAGTRLQAGTAVLEVSDLFNEACVKWKTRYGAAAKAWVTAPGHPDLRLRGVLCRIIGDGEVTLTDRLQVIARPG